LPLTKPIELSVVIPCFNAEGTIATQLEALAAQKWDKPWEVVVSDNGATDRSIDVVRSFEGRVPNLRVVDSSALRRQSYALNAGARAAAGKAFVFCDADDEVAPGWVAIFGEALLRHPVVHGQICFDKFNTSQEAETLSKLWQGGLYRGQFLPHAGAANIGVQRAVHQAIGGFDTNLPRFADSDYSWRLQLEGYEFHYEPTAIYQYRISRVNPSLSYLFRRGWTAPAADYWTYKKFRGLGVTKEMVLPRHRTFMRSLESWWQTIRNMPRSCWQSREARHAWLQRFVSSTGEVYGQCKGRLISPCRPFEPRSDGYRAKIDFNFRTVR
jgi:glycosyltransferase involved in cell wall biosynthesis